MCGFYYDTEIIKSITGVRRSGKSCLMEMVKNELLQGDVQAERIIFLVEKIRCDLSLSKVLSLTITSVNSIEVGIAEPFR